MIKWIKNTYYMWMNTYYGELIRQANVDLLTGDISRYYHRLIVRKWKSKITENLSKILL